VRPTDRNTGRGRDRERHKKDLLFFIKYISRALAAPEPLSYIAHRELQSERDLREKVINFGKKNREDPIHLVRK
jgi:hypothetical protein